MDNIKLSFAILNLVCYCHCANILSVIPFTQKSHYNMLRPIGLELAKRGHNVTVITAFREKDHPPTYHQVMADDKTIWDLTGGGVRPNVFKMIDLSAEEFFSKILWVGNVAVTEMALKSPEVKEFLEKDQKFDVVIAEMFFLEAWHALAHKYDAPLVLVTTFGNCMRNNILLRNPLQLATVMSEFLTVKEPNTFLGRLRNVCFTVYEFFWWKFWYLEKQEALVKKYIPNLAEPVPSLEELQRNASLILLNSHFSFDPLTAYIPNQVEIGGIHLTHKFDPLPKDIKHILDTAKNGIIYMSFGSNIHSSELPLDKKNAFVNVFKRLKYTVLWKWEEENLEGKPDNLHIRKWLPQKEILAHPNVKLFISHGGLIGTQEAVFHGVPIIGVPIYADQYNNLLQTQEAGMGKILDYKKINEDNLESALRDVLEDPNYMIKAKELSARFQDRPMSALDTAMFWIEYVIRNKGAGFMKNPALNISWVAYYMIDVFGFIVGIVGISLYLILKLIRICIGKMMSDKLKSD